jgi:hypothetical protein
MTQLTPFQQAIIDIVSQYPGQFTRSGLAKMLVGAKSWQDASYPEYGRFAQYTRKELAYQIEILGQQGYVGSDKDGHLIPAE